MDGSEDQAVDQRCERDTWNASPTVGCVAQVAIKNTAKHRFFDDGCCNASGDEYDQPRRDISRSNFFLDPLRLSFLSLMKLLFLMLPSFLCSMPFLFLRCSLSFPLLFFESFLEMDE